MSVPYIGAKISLTSRSSIRYEGILASVDPKEATISLEQVRMMGTEGRRPGNDIPPLDEVYDIVIFRSADIDDLQIFETPAPAAAAPPKPSFVDPAIVSSRNSAVSNAAFRPNPAAPVVAQVEPPTVSWPPAPRLQFGSVTPSTSAANNSAAATRWNSEVATSPIAKPVQNSSFTSSTAQKAPTFGSIANNNPSASFNNGSASKSSYGGATTEVKQAESNTERVRAYNTGTGKMELIERQSRSYAAVLSDGAGRFRLSKEGTERMVPRNEYDFQQANARLQKDPSLTTEPKENFYDRTTSFFDNISCESMVGKPLDKNERRWNIETFGVPAPSGGVRIPHHHRGGSNSITSRGRGRPTYNDRREN